MSDRAPTYCLGDDFHDKFSTFVDQFLHDGFELFSTEFANLEPFLAKVREEVSDRNDVSLRRTAREMYLLEAVAFEIYDRLNREAFNQAEKTLIVLPDCLSLHNPDCMKTDEPYGDRCQQCMDSCQASEIAGLAEPYGIEVVFSKRKLTKQLDYYKDQSACLGVIGIGCILMLAEGMRAAAESGIPARGVLLNFCGCEHWNNEPFASEFPLARLRKILEEKYG